MEVKHNKFVSDDMALKLLSFFYSFYFTFKDVRLEFMLLLSSFSHFLLICTKMIPLQLHRFLPFPAVTIYVTFTSRLSNTFCIQYFLGNLLCSIINMCSHYFSSFSSILCIICSFPLIYLSPCYFSIYLMQIFHLCSIQFTFVSSAAIFMLHLHIIQSAVQSCYIPEA